MKTRLDRETIALRVVKEFQDGDVVNLGFGIGDLCASYIPEGKDIIFHSEGGVAGFGPVLTEEELNQADWDLITTARFVAPQAGMSFFDFVTAFAAVRGGRVDYTVLGALQVSEKGDLANWSTTGLIEDAGIGGSMDIAVGAKKVIVAMTHSTFKGEPKIVLKCRYPLTARECVNMIVTDLAVIQVTKGGLLLTEIAPGWTIDEVKALTEPKLLVSPNLKEIEL